MRCRRLSLLFLCLLLPSHALLTPATTTTTASKPLARSNKPLSSTAAPEVPSGGSANSNNNNGGTATIPTEVFNLVKSIVGAGVLSLPYGVAAFSSHPSALLPAVTLVTVAGTLSAWTFGWIGRACQATNTESYSDACQVLVPSQLFAKLVAFSCFFDCFVGNLSYSMILADTVQQLAAGLGGIVLSRNQALLGVTGVTLLPLCLLKNLSSLAPFSLVGIAGMVYTTAAMAVRYFGKAYTPTGMFAAQAGTFGTATTSVLSPKLLILACMLSNAYIAHFNAPTFLKELKNNTQQRFHQVIGYSFGASVLLYAAVTALGFLTFGAASNGLILNNYATTDGIMSASRLAVAVSVTASYPLIFVGCRDGLRDLFNVNTSSNLWTFGLLGVVTVLASVLRDLGLVAAVGGATFGTALVYLYPALLFWRLQGQQKRRTMESVGAIGVGLLGIAMMVLGTKLSLDGVV